MPETKVPAATQAHTRLAPTPVHVKPVAALHVLAPVAEIEPVGQGVQLAAEFPAGAYESVAHDAHAAVEPVPDTYFPAAMQLHARLSPAPVQVKPVAALHVLAPVDDVDDPVGHGAQLAAEFPATAYEFVPHAAHVADDPEPDT